MDDFAALISNKIKMNKQAELEVYSEANNIKWGASVREDGYYCLCCITCWRAEIKLTVGKKHYTFYGWHFTPDQAHEEAAERALQYLKSVDRLKVMMAIEIKN